MKRSLRTSLLVAALAVAGLVALGGCNESKTLINVNEASADPAAYSGAISIVGVTKAFSRTDTTVFGLMDLKELQCTTPNCNQPLLPVKYQGPLPQIGDEVHVTGSFTQVQGGYVFTASELKIVRQHRLGG